MHIIVLHVEAGRTMAFPFYETKPSLHAQNGICLINIVYLVNARL